MFPHRVYLSSADRVFQVIRKTSVVAKYKAAASNLKPRKIQNTWSPVLKQNLQKIVDASAAQKVQQSHNNIMLRVAAACLKHRCRSPLTSVLRSSRLCSPRSTGARAAVR